MKHDPLEPDRDTFCERDTAGLCIDCGENPQPERRGDDGTHHRCDECWSVYLRRQQLRERLSSEEWFCPGGVPPVFPERCDECGGAFDQRRFVLCCLYWDTRENRQKGKRRVKACLCSDCIEGCGYLERLNEAKSVLLIASLDVVQIDAERDGKNYSEVDLEVNITVPRAVAGMAATGFDLAQWLWDQRITTWCYSTEATDVLLDIKVAVKPGRADNRAHALATMIAKRLTGECRRVIVPADRYKSLREAVYDAHGKMRAKRLARSDRGA